MSKTATTPREEWNKTYNRIVEYFTQSGQLDHLDPDGTYPIEDDPYVCHVRHEAPLHEDDNTDRKWTILLNPWDGRAREAWIIDGEPLRPEETTYGAPDDVEDPLIANDRDLAEVHPGRAVVCVALTKVAGVHSRGETWVHSDKRIEEQFEIVLDELLENGSNLSDRR